MADQQFEPSKSVAAYKFKIARGGPFYQLQRKLGLLTDGSWSIFVSNTIFWFLLLRWFWKMIVWSSLMAKFSKLEMRLVVSHPDGYAGLAFVSLYPNAFAPFILGISCVLGAGIAYELLNGTLEITNYGYFMSLWLAMVLLLFVTPLLSYRRPLKELKEDTLSQCSARATEYYRILEREHLGKNIASSSEDEGATSKDVSDPTKEFTAAQKLSTNLVRREVLIPLSTAALLPLVVSGVTLLPIKELFEMLKKLILI